MKYFYLPIISFFILSHLFAQNLEPSIKFYVPLQQEYDSFFRLGDYLSKYLENDEITIDQQMFVNFFKNTIKNDSMMASYLVEAFLRTTNNSNVRNLFRSFITDNNIRYEHKDVIMAFFKKELNQKDKRYLLPDNKYAELIDLFSLNEASLWEGRLHSTIFSNNPWETITLDTDPNLVIFICGGGTNAFTMTYRRYQGSLDDFIKDAVNFSYYKQSYPNWFNKQLPIEDILSKSNADFVSIGFGNRIDNFSIKDGTIVLFLYSNKYHEGYSISWNMNFSRINIFYNDPFKLWNYLSEMILFNWIE